MDYVQTTPKDQSNLSCSITNNDKIDGWGIAICFFIAVVVLCTLIGTCKSQAKNYDMGDVSAMIPDMFKHWDLEQHFTSIFVIAKRNQFPSFDGIRAISMMWVVFGHTILMYASYPTLNPRSFYSEDGLIASFTGQIIQNAEYSVDTFFYLSGFLVTWVSAKKIIKTQEPAYRFVPFAFLNRILRLSPVNYFTMLMAWKIFPTIGTGPMTLGLQGNKNLCDKHWVQFFFYLGNLIPYDSSTNTMCWGVAWYLAVDIQLYVFSFVLLYAYMYDEKKGMIATFVTILMSTLAGVITAADYGWTNFIGDSDGDSVGKYYYVKPWMRFHCFGLGMLFAMYWRTYGQHRNWSEMSTTVVTVVSLLTYGLIFTLCYGSYGVYKHNFGYYGPEHKTDPTLGWIHAGLERPAWGVALCGLTFLCLTKRAGPVGTFLSANFWVPIARLSFCAYMVHIAVLEFVFTDSTQYYRYSDVGFTVKYCGVLLLTFASATVLMAIIELPFASIQKVFFSPPRKQKQSSAVNDILDTTTYERFKDESVTPSAPSDGLRITNEFEISPVKEGEPSILITR